MTAAPRFPDLTIGILAGGAGRRFGGLDKGWIEIDGVPQIVRLLDSLVGIAACVVVSANRSIDRYRQLGVEVVCDPWPDYPGPLAGVVSLLEATRSRHLLTLPVDAFDVPADLVERIAGALDERIVTVSDADGAQPLFAGYPQTFAAAARDAFERGERSVVHWQRSLEHSELQLGEIRLGNRNAPGEPAVGPWRRDA